MVDLGDTLLLLLKSTQGIPSDILSMCPFTELYGLKLILIIIIPNKYLI